VRDWAGKLEEAGVRLFILSNNRSKYRTERFCSVLGVPFIAHAGKPRKKNILLAMQRMGADQSNTAMVGDQFFTDGLGAKRAGLPALLVRPLEMRSNPFRALRYLLERPLRAAMFQKGNGAF
jgi:HAD superfamily phosphatase (TIGR01668 family)